METLKLKTIPNAYGFGRDWILSVDGREFWLGQDAKVCSRVLGCSPKDIIWAYENETGREYTEFEDQKFQSWLTDQLWLALFDHESVRLDNLNDWDLCVQ